MSDIVNKAEINLLIKSSAEEVRHSLRKEFQTATLRFEDRVEGELKTFREEDLKNLCKYVGTRLQSKVFYWAFSVFSGIALPVLGVMFGLILGADSAKEISEIKQNMSSINTSIIDMKEDIVEIKDDIKMLES